MLPIIESASIATGEALKDWGAAAETLTHGITTLSTAPEKGSGRGTTV